MSSPATNGEEAGNAGSVDLTNCDREPIHRLGHVQSYGCLLAVSTDWIVSHVSANARDLLGIDPEAVIGTPVTQHLPNETVHRIRSRMQVLSDENSVARVFGLEVLGDGRAFDVSIHVSGRNFVLEFEPKDAGAAGGRDDLTIVQPLIARVRGQDTIAGAAREGARALRALTGIDRVMVYQFQADESGTVVAESRAGHMDSYLDLRFPASDIPAQARALYTRSLLRIIADVDGATHPVLPALGADGEPLDLSLSITRAVSPIHLEYLRNMGVGASLSVSILRKGKLWGLFACHHAEPFHIDFERRTAVELFAQLFAYELARIEAEAEMADTQRARTLHDSLMSQLSSGMDLVAAFDTISDRIRGVIPHDGIAIYADGNFKAAGSTPTEEEFAGLARFLNTAAASTVYATDNISARYPRGDGFADRAAGLLALPVSRTPRDYVVLFRREITRTVAWAGNPNKPVETGPHGLRLTPRKSFEAWQEVVHGQSEAWTLSERRAAEALRVTLLEVVLKLSDEAKAASKRAHEQQELLIAELNHRVRNILNLIRGLVSQGKTDIDTVDAYAKILDDRIYALSRAHDQLTGRNWEWSSLTGLIRTEIEAFLQNRADRVLISGGDVEVSPKAFTTLALVIHELVTNSAKYGALSDRRGRVEIALDTDATGSLGLRWREHDGPAVQPPTRRGFGTTIIERSIPFELRGTADLTFRLTGLEAAFTIPSAYVRPAAPTRARESGPVAAPPRPEIRLQGRALLVEDNMIIAMDAADLLAELGADTVDTASDVDGALRLIDQGPLAFAMLDVNLGPETSLPVAHALAERGIPFILTTGYGATADIKSEYPVSETVAKPYTIEDVKEALIRSRYPGSQS